MLGSHDFARSKRFYDAVLGTLGVAPATPDARQRLMYWHRGALFLVGPPLNGEPATVVNGGTIGFTYDSEADVEAWHAAGIANGGATCEDPPWPRAGPGMALSLAYLRDPDGHKLCAVYRPG